MLLGWTHRKSNRNVLGKGQAYVDKVYATLTDSHLDATRIKICILMNAIVQKVEYAGKASKGNAKFVKHLETVHTTAAKKIGGCSKSSTTSAKVSRGRAGHTIILYDFPPDISVKVVFLQQLYCFQYNRTVLTTPHGKRHNSRTKPVKRLQSILEESLHRPQPFFFNGSRSRKSAPCYDCISSSCAYILVILQPLTRKLLIRYVGRASRSIRGRHRSECEWLALSPKINVKQHR